MRLFQNSAVYAAYLPRLNKLAAGKQTFRQRLDVFLYDRFGASHFLEPVLSADQSAFFTNADDMVLQNMWAAEHGMPADSSPEVILLAQIEDHRAEVFYNLDPMRFPSAFVRRLPGCVKRSVAWRAAPSPGADFGAYDLIVCNFPTILKSYTDRGWAAAFFSRHTIRFSTSTLSTRSAPSTFFSSGLTRATTCDGRRSSSRSPRCTQDLRWSCTWTSRVWCVLQSQRLDDFSRSPGTGGRSRSAESRGRRSSAATCTLRCRRPRSC